MVRIKTNRKTNELQSAYCKKLKDKRKKKKHTLNKENAQGVGRIENRAKKWFTVGLLLMKQLKKQNKTHLENGEMVQQLRLKASSWVPWLPS